MRLRMGPQWQRHLQKMLASIRNVYHYPTTIIHVSCDENIQQKSELERQESGVIQCTNSDFKEKQALFVTLLGDYINAAHTVLFYYRKSMDSSICAAYCNEDRLCIYNPSAFSSICEIHDAIKGAGFSEKMFSMLQKIAPYQF
jgi:hypothetical protein